LLRTVVLRKTLVDTRATGCKTQQIRFWTLYTDHYYGHKEENFIRTSREFGCKMFPVLAIKRC
jgi:hypothetical protein